MLGSRGLFPAGSRAPAARFLSPAPPFLVTRGSCSVRAAIGCLSGGATGLGNYASGVGAQGSRGSSGNGVDRERWGQGGEPQGGLPSARDFRPLPLEMQERSVAGVAAISGYTPLLQLSALWRDSFSKV